MGETPKWEKCTKNSKNDGSPDDDHASHESAISPKTGRLSRGGGEGEPPGGAGGGEGGGGGPPQRPQQQPPSGLEPASAPAPGGGGLDDLGSSDEVKVFKDEDEVDGSVTVSHQAELLAEKSSLITESEQVRSLKKKFRTLKKYHLLKDLSLNPS